MALKAVLPSKTDVDALPEAVRALYSEQGGKYVLTVDGLVPETDLRDLKTKLAEFRDNNVALLKKVADLEPLVDKFKDVDVDEYKTLKATVDDLKKKGLKKPDDLESVIKSSIDAAIKPLQDKLTAEETARKAAQAAADDARFRELVTARATKSGLRAQSVRHVVREARDVFDLKDQDVVAKSGKTDPDDPLKPITLDAWFAALQKTDSYLFEDSIGGGAPPNGNKNPPRKDAKILVNPSAEDMGRHMDDIASGKVIVQRT